MAISGRPGCAELSDLASIPVDASAHREVRVQTNVDRMKTLPRAAGCTFRRQRRKRVKLFFRVVSLFDQV
jgi:hypothetical protein